MPRRACDNVPLPADDALLVACGGLADSICSRQLLCWTRRVYLETLEGRR